MKPTWQQFKQLTETMAAHLDNYADAGTPDPNDDDRALAEDCRTTAKMIRDLLEHDGALSFALDIAGGDR